MVARWLGRGQTLGCQSERRVSSDEEKRGLPSLNGLQSKLGTVTASQYVDGEARRRTVPSRFTQPRVVREGTPSAVLRRPTRCLSALRALACYGARLLSRSSQPSCCVAHEARARR